LEHFRYRKPGRAAVSNIGAKIMSVMKLNQIAGMLTLTVALCGAGMAFAQNAPFA
jgi:hypothetical protein